MYLTKKYLNWVNYYTDSNNKKTFGNATQSALIAYGSKSYNLASVIGSKNIRKHKMLSLNQGDSSNDFTLLLKIALKKVVNGNYSDWENFMKRIGYFD